MVVVVAVGTLDDMRVKLVAEKEDEVVVVW
jgi:hypothetical protein